MIGGATSRARAEIPQTPSDRRKDRQLDQRGGLGSGPAEVRGLVASEQTNVYDPSSSSKACTAGGQPSW